LHERFKKKLEELIPKHNRVWYATDGVFSMYGDCAPLKELEELLNQYKQFHLYIDDAHGMSSFGKNGTGYVLSKIPLHPKMILATALGKAFGTIGGIFVIPDRTLCEKIRNCAGPLIFSSQQSIPVLGASIASAKIHLSDNIYTLQKDLAEKISHCHNLLREYNLPDISDPETPIFFVALGSMKVGFSLVKKMMKAGYFLNLAIFPAVSETCTGIRFTINCHHSLEDIESMIKALSTNFIEALEIEQHSIDSISKAFKRVANLERFVKTAKRSDVKSIYNLVYSDSISTVNSEEWNKLFDGDTAFDYNALNFLEETFKNNLAEEHNCRFHYFLVRDSSNKPVIATFFTSTTVKDDMLAPSSISMEIENVRSKDPYYLTSKALIMGSILSTGDYLYLDRSNKDWRRAFVYLLNAVRDIAEKEDTNLLLLRDFKSEDVEIHDFLIEQGFLKTDIPSNHTIMPSRHKNNDDFLGTLNHSQRQYIKHKALKNENLFDVQILNTCSEKDIQIYEMLFENVRRKNYEINTFGLPSKFLEKLNFHSNWEIIQLQLKPNNHTVAAMLCFKNKSKYFPIFVGLDYQYLDDYNIYAQILWQTIKRGIHLKSAVIQLGLTASQNKRKFGAITTQQVVYAQLKDNYNYNIISLMANKRRA